VLAGLAVLALVGCRTREKDSPAAAPAHIPKAPTWAKEPVSPHPPADPAKKKKHDLPAADNSRCYVCHLNLEDETLVSVHAKGGIGCMKCHGECDDHCGDEGHETPPEIMYPKEKIADACLKCHLEVKPPPGFQPPANASTTRTCSECHFGHRLTKRERVWDKVTGKILR
jgi:hypothetical protein